MELSRRVRYFSLFGVLAAVLLLIGRTSHANTYETSLLDVIRADGRFNTYIRALEQTGLDQMLIHNGDFTVFAPTDAAFARLPAATRDAAFADTNLLRQLLLHHMLLSRWETSVIGGWDVVHSLLGKQIDVSVHAGTLFLDEARVTRGNIVADNGLVHIIDGVLIPPTGAFDSNQHTSPSGQAGPTPQTETAPNAPIHVDGTIYEIIATDARFRTLASATQNAGLGQMLDKNGPFTLFAPTNAAFEALPAGTFDNLMADKAAIRQLVLFHLVQGRFDSDRLETLQTLRMALGKNTEVAFRNGSLFIDDARIVVKDVGAENGFIHVIDVVLMPK